MTPLSALFAEKMHAAAVSPLASQTFQRCYTQLVAGETGLLPEDSLHPLAALPPARTLPTPSNIRDELTRTVVIKLNGGLGTSMGMTRAKSLLPIKNGLSFLDVIARQVLRVRKEQGVRLPLLLMNSHRSQQDSLEALNTYPDLFPEESPLPRDFLQNMVPKVNAADLSPAVWPQNPELEWCPPGHGDFYAAIVSSHTLETLLSQNYEYAFISNADNLGAVLDPAILSWFSTEKIPFLMEAATRTMGDRKGGHLALDPAGNFLLRESAMCPLEDKHFFQDITRHRYFNTNTIWLNLRALARTLEKHDQVLPLPMIRNTKNIDPTDPSSPQVYQLETAIGTAIPLFKGAHAIEVGRERFVPVKTTNDLLALRSDAYDLDGNDHIVLAQDREGITPVVQLDPKYFKLPAQFEERFPTGPPSLLHCSSLIVRGNVFFGKKISISGNAVIEHPANGALRIPDDTEIQG